MKLFQDWTEALPLAMQGVLATAVRGPDGASRECAAKPLVRALRKTFMNNAHEPGAKPHDNFMGDFSGLPVPRDAHIAFWDNHDEYPHHWMMHFIHAAQIVSVFHPRQEIRDYWTAFYVDACESMHMRPEPIDALRARLVDHKSAKYYDHVGQSR